MKKYYIASSFQNQDNVRYVSRKLNTIGFIHTYDWTKNERASILVDLKRIGEEEKAAVIKADFLIVLLPAGKGCNIKFGIALGQEKKICLYSENNEVNNFATTSTFYHLSEVEIVTRPIDALIDRVIHSES